MPTDAAPRIDALVGNSSIIDAKVQIPVPHGRHACMLKRMHMMGDGIVTCPGVITMDIDLAVWRVAAETPGAIGPFSPLRPCM